MANWHLKLTVMCINTHMYAHECRPHVCTRMYTRTHMHSCDNSEAGGRFPQNSEAKDRKTQPIVLVPTAECARGSEEQTREGGRKLWRATFPVGGVGEWKRAPESSGGPQQSGKLSVLRTSVSSRIAILMAPRRAVGRDKLAHLSLCLRVLLQPWCSWMALLGGGGRWQTLVCKSHLTDVGIA